MAKAMTHEAEYTKTVAFGKTSTFKVELRELANHWVDKHSTKFSKMNGFQIGEKYNPKILNIKSIKEIEMDIKVRCEWHTDYDWDCTCGKQNTEPEGQSACNKEYILDKPSFKLSEAKE